MPYFSVRIVSSSPCPTFRYGFGVAALLMPYILVKIMSSFLTMAYISVRFMSSFLTVPYISIRIVSSFLTMAYVSVRFMSSFLTVPYIAVRIVSSFPTMAYISARFVSSFHTVPYISVRILSSLFSNVVHVGTDDEQLRRKYMQIVFSPMYQSTVLRVMLKSARTVGEQAECVDTAVL